MRGKKIVTGARRLLAEEVVGNWGLGSQRRVEELVGDSATRAWRVEEGGLARVARSRVRVGWRDAWEQGRKGGPGTWAVVAECGPVALGRPKGIVSFVNYSKIFKWVLIDLVQRWTFRASKFQIKYGIDGFEERKNFLHRNFFKFEIHFEWKFREASRFEIQ
jgi:hypothetical protein